MPTRPLPTLPSPGAPPARRSTAGLAVLLLCLVLLQHPLDQRPMPHRPMPHRPMPGPITAAPAPVFDGAPAAPLDLPVAQPDGSVFLARAWGDETASGLETREGYALVQDADGAWVYAELFQGGLVPARPNGKRLLAGQDPPVDLPRGLRPEPAPALAPAQASPPPAPSSLARALGDQPLLVILVSFADEQIAYAASKWQSRAFGASGSIHAYYESASYGKLRITPAAEHNGTNDDGVVSVTLSTNHPNTGSTAGGAEVIRAALALADASVDFGVFDANRDSIVTTTELHILVIAAGNEAAYNKTLPHGLWAHMAGLYGLQFDGVRLQRSTAAGDYGVAAVAGERHDSHQATIGVLVHELGHTFSFPDLYDTDGSSAGVGNWSLMGGGTWNSTSLLGDAPAQPDAFLKWYAGWLSPTAASPGRQLSLAPSHTRAGALLVGDNPAGVDWEFQYKTGAGEYWLVENRAEAGLPGCGLLIWHIDETANFSTPNNNEARPLVELEQADGLNNLAARANSGDSGDPYPGSANNIHFNDTSLPSSRYHSGQLSAYALAVTPGACGASMMVKTLTTNLPLPEFLLFLPRIVR